MLKSESLGFVEAPTENTFRNICLNNEKVSFDIKTTILCIITFRCQHTQDKLGLS